MRVWRKSSFSGTGPDNNCVELAAPVAGAIRVRESDAPGVVLTATPRALDALIRVAGSGGLMPRQR
ncbi:DUF397 domain-containing protein [Streptomyces sp. NPDC049577]|uniref:DUF397 domain-containing protein n=1 Tax=Streptomyces sp. NPDC049577 TaxID=3155153 RepID=UPI003445C253